VVLGQTSKRSRSAKTGKAEPSRATVDPVYAPVPFDPSVTSLPPGYRGNDTTMMYDRLQKAVGSKSEFETTAEYASRINTAVGHDVYGFTVPESRFTYDADHQVVRTTVGGQLVKGYELFTASNFRGFGKVLPPSKFATASLNMTTVWLKRFRREKGDSPIQR
jgi:hypothetical protein